jgi:hypothetical protein
MLCRNSSCLMLDSSSFHVLMHNIHGHELLNNHMHTSQMMCVGCCMHDAAPALCYIAPPRLAAFLAFIHREHRVSYKLKGKE